MRLNIDDDYDEIWLHHCWLLFRGDDDDDDVHKKINIDMRHSLETFQTIKKRRMF